MKLKSRLVYHITICLFSRAGGSSPTAALTTTTTTFASSLPRQPRPTPPNTLNLTTFNEPLDLKKEKLSPGDKLSQKLISPNLVQSVRCPSPVVHNVESNVLSPVQDTKVSFEAKGMAETSKSTVVELSRTKFSSVTTSSISNFHQNVSTLNNFSCATSPVLPEIRNIIAENHSLGQNVKTPPPPPPRWAKPGIGQSQSNFSVTATVTFNLNHTNDVGSSQVMKFVQKEIQISLAHLVLNLWISPFPEHSIGSQHVSTEPAERHVEQISNIKLLREVTPVANDSCALSNVEASPKYGREGA